MGIDAIEEFRKSHGINTKGNLAGILQLNRAFSKDTLPINPDDYLTGQRTEWCELPKHFRGVPHQEGTCVRRRSNKPWSYGHNEGLCNAH